MKHLKLFASHSQFIEPTDKPAVSYCEQENEVHYSPFDPFNGHEYVDLGLPSGTLWAKCNVGATNETDYGLYFAWGETEGYAIKYVDEDWIIDGEKAFTWNDYKWTEDGGSTVSKYNLTDDKTVLDAEDDAVVINMGGKWHMPNIEQYRELLNTEYVTNEWVENYNGSGINGRLFTSVSNGNTLFIPATGICEDGDSYHVNYGGNYCISHLYTEEEENIQDAGDFHFASSGYGLSSCDRCKGRAVRGVVGQIDATPVLEK